MGKTQSGVSPIVANASPLIALAKIDRFPLLHHLFGEVVVPEAVWIEVTVRGAGKPAANLLLSACQQGWLQRRKVNDLLAVAVLRATLGPGEAEAIVLAQEIEASWVLLDDDLARAQAARIGLRVKGTAGILLTAYQAGLLEDLRRALDDLRTKGFWLSERVYRAILAEAGIG